jgi:hypothetical protein
LLRLEKRSQALQGCNLTRNIQVDGAPRVHPPGGFVLPGFFCPTFGHRSPCLENPPAKLQAALSLVHDFQSARAAFAVNFRLRAI